jgi:hypothetical protein
MPNNLEGIMPKDKEAELVAAQCICKYVLDFGLAFTLNCVVLSAEEFLKEAGARGFEGLSFDAAVQLTQEIARAAAKYNDALEAIERNRWA